MLKRLSSLETKLNLYQSFLSHQWDLLEILSLFIYHLHRPKLTLVCPPLPLLLRNGSDPANANLPASKCVDLQQASPHSLQHLAQILSCPALHDNILSRLSSFFCSLLVSFTDSFFLFPFLMLVFHMVVVWTHCPLVLPTPIVPTVLSHPFPRLE